MSKRSDQKNRRRRRGRGNEPESVAEPAPSSKTKLLPYIATFAFIGFVGGVTLLYTQPTKQTPKQPVDIVQPQQKKSIDDYIQDRVDIINDTSAQTLYIILQNHQIDWYAEGVLNDPAYAAKVREEVTPNQTSIYRILEHLHKNEGLQLVVKEGLSHTDYTDVNNPNIFKNALDKNTPGKFDRLKRDIEAGDDSELQHYIKKGHAGSTLAAVMYTDLFGLGFEVPKTHAAHTKFEMMALDETLSEDERLAAKGKAEKYRKERSADALSYAMEHAKTLFEQGKITNQNAAIILGSGHYDDLLPVMLQVTAKELPYNIVVIVPVGKETNDKTTK